MTQQKFDVSGMTCENCARHVRTAIGALPGVVSVKVDLAAGRADVEANAELDRAVVARALEDEGYALR